ncbi:GNAT family N-acetyltransferase [Massilia sp. RP-1-19]|uniref:GNAT family N-acetyltransferase n=1 Tax=Massilia polaris TaxID=2728846 RepID=A0A848HJU6_9BURK|nr:GNAT family N-acetyltransferase [Massilia polaris]NML60409.1 GNAT family N-acetyltransferase [Massilia polaris]
MRSIEVRDVTRTHSALIPSLFPGARDVKATPAMYAAYEGPALIGFALLCSPTGAEHPAYRFDLAVAPQMRRRGAASAMLEHVIGTARTLRAPSLRPLAPVDSEIGHKLMARFGFAPRRRTLVFEFAFDKAFDHVDIQHHHLEVSGRLPAGLADEPYRDNAARDLSTLCVREFGILTRGHLEACGEYPAPNADISHARAFRVNGVLAGALGIVVRDGIAAIDPLLIAPGSRNTWAFTHIIHSTLRRLVAQGCTRGVAHIHEDNTSVLALARRFRVRQVGAASLYELPLPYASESE